MLLFQVILQGKSCTHFGLSIISNFAAKLSKLGLTCAAKSKVVLAAGAKYH